MNDQERQLPGDDEDDLGEESNLFAGDSPRWRETGVDHTTEARRREHDAPAPAQDADGAIERTAELGDETEFED